MMPLCHAETIGVTPYSPLAAGRLTRDASAASTLRSKIDQIAKREYDATANADARIVARVAELARRLGVTRAQVALAWLLQKQSVTAPIVGATKAEHLDIAVIPSD